MAPQVGVKKVVVPTTKVREYLNFITLYARVHDNFWRRRLFNLTALRKVIDNIVMLEGPGFRDLQ